MTAVSTMPPASTLIGPSRSQRIVSLVFPHLPADRVARLRWGLSWLSKGRPDHPPVVFVAHIDNTMRLAALDRTAQAAGLKVGLGLAEARAMRPGIDVIPLDPAADRTLLENLADWCGRYTPLVALDGVNGLYLDVTGCVHLHGSEKALIGDLLDRLFHLGVEAQAAIAGTPGLAFAAARFGGGPVVGIEQGAALLQTLPVSALRLPAETVAGLARVGLKRISDLMQAHRAPLSRRFGPAPLRRLDQALGHEDEPISPRLAVAALSCERSLAEPVVSEEAILSIALMLGRGLKAMLDARGEGGRLFELRLFRVDGRVFFIEAGTSAPLKEPERIAALFRERMQALHDEIEAGFGFELLRLSALRTERIDDAQRDFSGSETGDQALSAFADRIFARFGPKSLLLPLCHESHIPERATVLAPYAPLVPARRQASVPSDLCPSSERPLRLLSHPEPVETIADIPEGPPRHFRWRRTLHRVRAAEGPERISAEWWREDTPEPTRDYFKVEDEAGSRYWLFRQGLYDGSEPHPRWFLHGIFA